MCHQSNYQRQYIIILVKFCASIYYITCILKQHMQAYIPLTGCIALQYNHQVVPLCHWY